jgi:hypothetical protein
LQSEEDDLIKGESKIMINRGQRGQGGWDEERLTNGYNDTLDKIK